MSPRISAEFNPDLSTSDLLEEKPAILFTSQIRQLDIKTRFSCRETPEQIEPFFLRLFIFDASIGARLSEEFHIEIPIQRFTELRSSSAIIASKQILPKRINGISRNQIKAAEKFIYTIQNPKPDLYLVAFIERILSDIPIDIYLKNNAIDAKTSIKIQQSISASFLRLNHLHTLFAWTATPIFPSLCSNRNFTTPNTNLRNCSIYKCDGKLTDIDLQKLLNDLQKPERVAKWISFPGANLTLKADVTSVLSKIPKRISPNYFPKRPWRVKTPDKTPLSLSFELQSFSDQQNLEPKRGFTNLLYVYPISLNYSSQKSFPKARNISCKVCFVQSKTRQTNNFLQTHPIYNRIDPNGPMVQSFNCAVQYHESAPAFNEEIKIQLPLSLDQTDHLLFTFSHISLATALSNKKSQANDTYETEIGYSWLPLSKENEMGFSNLIMSENYQEFDLPVAANLPQNYIQTKMMGGKEGGSICSNSDIKLVEGGKHLFRVRLRLISTIFTTQERIQNFFQYLGSYFKVVFYGQNHFGDEHKTEWIYREPWLTSLAEACDRMVESVRLALGHDRVQILSERMDNGDNGDKLDPNIAHIQVTFVEPCQSEEILRKLKNGDGSSDDKLLEKINSTMNYSAHTNVRTFIQEEKLMDTTVAEGEPEMARTALRRLVLTVENAFPNTRRRQRIVRTEEMILTPLELACESLLFKANQIRRILAAAGIPKAHFGVYHKKTLKRVDLKQLQLFLQGSVSPTVNAGLLAYAEAFTTPTQKQRYGKNGIGQLVSAFKILIAELDDALRVNEAAMAGQRPEYQEMLRQSFDGMLERLSMFFDGEKFLQRSGSEEKANGNEKEFHSFSIFGKLKRSGSSRTSSTVEMHIFDSISG